MMSPSLIVLRLIVTKNGHRVYDQKFHKGFNVIRGSNGSGKSTIMEFLFFGLGGDLKDWKEHASSCDEVLVEVSANGTPLVLRRVIDGGKRIRPMSIFMGDFESAISSVIDGWIHVPFSRGKNTDSFTQVLFNSLDIPEMPGEDHANITMHQILRLIYVDQTSPIQRIFRLEPQYDSKDIREATSDLLCGIGGSELYSARLKLRTKKKDYSEIATKLDNILKAGAALQESLTEGALQDKTSKLRQEKDLLAKKLAEIERSEVNSKDISKEAESKRAEISQKALKIKNDLIDADEGIKALDYEIDDSKKFISHLKMMLTEFESSAQVFQSLGSVKYERCPACHDELSLRADNECHLCGKEQAPEELETKNLAVKLDLEGQITESERLLTNRRQKKEALSRERTSGKRQLTSLLNRLDKIRIAPVDGRSTLIHETSLAMGRIEAQIEELEKLSNLSNEVARLSGKKSKLQGEISNLDVEISGYEKAQKIRRNKVNSDIIDNVKYFLKLDLAEHKDFNDDDLDKFDFNFKDDWFAINGQPNISTSASGMNVVKNSLFLSLLKTSLNDGKMRYPRLLLLDNVEDKGMVSPRIHNYQKIIAAFCDAQEVDHQVIITTSSLNEDLEIPDYTIGDSYTNDHRSLKLEPKVQGGANF